MFVLLAIVFLVGAANSINEGKDTSPHYEGSKVFSAPISDDDQFWHISDLRNQGKVTFLNEGPIRGRPQRIVFLAREEHLREVEETLQILHINADVLADNLQQVLDRESGGPRTFSKHLVEGPFDLISYPSYDQIVKHIEFYARDQLRGKHVTKFVIGTSYLGKPIVGAKFDRGNNGEKPVIFIECGIHPREWISITTCAWMIHEFSFNAAKYRDILDKFEVRIVPSVNPDGYEHTKTRRFWRGNMKPSEKDPNCRGVDVNRNFDIGEFCGPGTSKNPCEEEYCGDGPFSEPETQALRDAVLEVKDRLHYYISLHAFGQLWMYPYSYTTDNATDRDALQRKAEIGTRAIEEVAGKKYTVGPIAQTLYAVTGSSVDWAYEHGARYAYVIELPPTFDETRGAMGFIVSPNQIKPIAKETFQGIRAMIHAE